MEQGFTLWQLNLSTVATVSYANASAVTVFEEDGATLLCFVVESLSQAATDIWTIDSGIATLAVLAEESLAQASFQTLSHPFSGWMTKPALPV